MAEDRGLGMIHRAEPRVQFHLKQLSGLSWVRAQCKTLRAQRPQEKKDDCPVGKFCSKCWGAWEKREHTCVSQAFPLHSSLKPHSSTLPPSPLYRGGTRSSESLTISHPRLTIETQNLYSTQPLQTPEPTGSATTPSLPRPHDTKGQSQARPSSRFREETEFGRKERSSFSQ